jgi:putative copper resistance protein D
VALATSFSAIDILTKSRLDPAPAALLLLAGWWYLAAVRRLVTRSQTGQRRKWSPVRTGCFLAGLAVVALATESGIAASDTTSFSAHVIQHLLLGMLAPVLLALGAPVTLALQASGRVTRRRLLRVLHSPTLSVISHPVTAWLLFGGSMFALYFTHLYAETLTNSWLHLLVHVHFVVAGSLFFWPVVGVDPTPHRLPFAGRLLYVLVALPFHTIIGVALVTQRKLIAPGLTLTDQQTGAGILWSAGEALGLIAMFVVVWQWMAAEEREAARHDRQLDAAIGSRLEAPAG